MLQFVMKPQTSTSLLDSKLGPAQLPGSKQPKPVGFNRCRRHTLCHGMLSGKQAFTAHPPSRQRGDGSSVSQGQMAWMEFAGGILVEPGLQRGQAHSWCDAVDVSAPCSIGSSSVFSPELTEPGSCFVLLFLQLFCWFGCFHNSPSPWKTHP